MLNLHFFIILPMETFNQYLIYKYLIYKYRSFNQYIWSFLNTSAFHWKNNYGHLLCCSTRNEDELMQSVVSKRCPRRYGEIMALAYQGAIRWEHHKISQLVIFNDNYHSFKRKRRKTAVSSRKTDKTAERREWWRDTVMATRGIWRRLMTSHYVRRKTCFN